MRIYRYPVGILFLSVLFFVIFAPASSAQSAIADSLPDLSGTWEPAGGMNGGEVGRGFSKEVPPLQPWAMTQYKTNRKGLTSLEDKGLDELDPLTYCFPPGEPRSMIMPYPFEVVQRPNIVYILFQFGSGIRRIYTDGRKHPKDVLPSWMGDSVGTWEGNTLVVDTVGLKPETWMDPTGVPHSDALHVVERFRRPKNDALEVEFSFDDPKTFTRTWAGTKIYHLAAPDTDLSAYFVCEENLHMGKANEAEPPK